MLVGLYKTTFPDYQIKRFNIYKEILRYNNVNFIELDISEKDFWEKIKGVDLFLYRFSHTDDDHQLTKSILPVIENYLSKKCFPNLATCWHFDDKIKEYYLLKSLEYPMIDSWIFWEKDHALNWLKTAEFPVIFKLKKGAGSSNVVLIKDKGEAKSIINKMFDEGIASKGIPHKNNLKFRDFEKFIKTEIHDHVISKINKERQEFWQVEKNYVLFQKFLPNNSYDTRVNVIGNRAFACKRFVRENDFRASGSGNWDVNKDHIDLRFIEIALKISRELKFQSMAYDFLIDEKGNPQICEMSWTYPDDLEQGYWDENLVWHSFEFIPPYFHLVDALEIPDLKYPKIINKGAH
jgi:glutathione synthase/RimK-type ligase-like ATP-grasp enzyme